MDKRQFINNCVEKEWQWCEDKGVHIKKWIGELNKYIMFTYPEKTILENEWEKIQPPDLTYMSRVVGYFSKIQNWNKSKMGELHGRHGGNYNF